MAQLGRPTKRTPARQELIEDALRAGNTRTAAAQYAGISYDVFKRWHDDSADFRGAIERAESEAEIRNVALIQKAASNGTWTAAAWWLERRRPEAYARRERVESTMELSGPSGGPLEIVSSLSDHEKRTLRDAIRAHLASLPGEADPDRFGEPEEIEAE